MKSRFYLPKVGDKLGVEKALNYHHYTNDAEFRQHTWEWTKVHWYLQGVRRLRPGPGMDGIPASHFKDESGSRRIRIDKLPQILQAAMGWALGVDIAPNVKAPSGITLDSTRRRALWQCFYDNFWERYDVDSFLLDYWYHIFTYGTVGVGAFECPDRMGGVLGSTLLLVPPWELRPLPSCTTRISEVAGVEWNRWVPYEWMKQNYGDFLKLPKGEDDKARLRVLKAPAGSKLQVEYAPASSAIGAVGFGSFGGSVKAGSLIQTQYGMDDGTPDNGQMEFVEMREHWVWGDDHTLLRWIVTFGEVVVLDIDYTNEKVRKEYGVLGNNLPIAPLHVARHLTVGSFYGQSLLSRAASMNREFEFLLGATIQNQIDRDMLTALAMPVDGSVRMNDLRRDLRAKILPFTPNPNAPTLEPRIISPPNQGDANLRLLAALGGIMDDTTIQGPLQSGQAPGRVDSAGGLAIIQEQQSKSQLPVIKSTAAAFKGLYKCLGSTMGHYASTVSTKGDKAFELDLVRIDESMIGVQFDRSSGKISVEPELLSDPQRIWVGIRQDSPRPKSSIRQDLDAMLKMQLISPIHWVIGALREGLDIPIVNRAPYYHYVQGWLDNIVLFGDGGTPGKLQTNSMAESAPIKLMTLMEFMASPSFLVASPDVQEAFEIRREQLESGGLASLPQGLASMDQMGNVAPPSGPLGQIASAGAPAPPPGPASLNPGIMQTIT